MNVASTTALRWAVSTRTSGEVLTAGCSAGALELAVLGVPAGSTPAEVEGWLHDLAGVALETSRDDVRVRAIPALLHHALTGLLFSQTELWTPGGVAGPCSAAFVDLESGAAFGWVGNAQVSLSLDGVPTEPQWVLVRDENGREARGVALPAGRVAQVTVEYWPAGEQEGQAPVAIEAEWAPAGHAAEPVESTLAAPRPDARPEPPAEAAARVEPVAQVPPPLPPELPTQQPGLASAAHEAHAASAPVVAAIESAAVEQAIAAGELAAHADDEDDEDDPAAGGSGTSMTTAQVEALEDLSQVAAPHPVANWLGRLMHWGRRPAREAAPEAAPAPAPPAEAEAEDGGAPVSAYDALLSESVPATPLEQTALELPPHEIPARGETESAEPAFELEPPAGVPVISSADLVSAVEPVAAAEPEIAPEPEPAAAAASVPALELTPAPAPEPESAHARAVAELRAVDASALPVLPVHELQLPAESGPLHIVREPVGAGDGFAIPRLPVREAPPAGPPVLRVAAAAAPPRIEPVPPVTPAAPATPPEPAAPAAESFAPRVLEPASAPPVLRVPTLPPASSPPVLRVQVPGRPAEAPPVLRVAPTAVPPPAIVPTPPVAPVASEPAAYAPSEASTISPTPRAWPVLPPPPAAHRLPPRAWAWAAVVLGVFAVGWLLGVLANPAQQEPGPVTRALRAIGLGPAHFDANVNSSPNGAWIAVDGKDLARRTPADIELSPGAHTLTLTLPDLGSTQVQVRGQQGGRVTVNPALNGALAVYASDPNVPIRVALDGRPMGYAPLQLESVAPGLHELQFTGPSMPAWAQTVQVGVRRTVQVVARPMMAPSNGVIQVTATLNDERGATPLNGAQVWVDGELHGVTPTSLDLPRGPHSLRLVWRGETAPVQVIDLPGGNQRYASFAFGLDAPSPQVVLMTGVHPATRAQNTVVSAGLQGLRAADVHEAWLHARMPEGIWSRWPMTVMPGSTGPVVVAVFPPQAFDAQGTSRWYVSATSNQGDEFFSDMQTATLGGDAVPALHRHRPRPAGTAPATPPATP